MPLHTEVLEGSEEEQDAEGSDEVAWLWICHGSEVPSRQQQVFGVAAAMLKHRTVHPILPAFIFLKPWLSHTSRSFPGHLKVAQNVDGVPTKRSLSGS